MSTSPIYKPFLWPFYDPLNHHSHTYKNTHKHKHTHTHTPHTNTHTHKHTHTHTPHIHMYTYTRTYTCFWFTFRKASIKVYYLTSQLKSRVLKFKKYFCKIPYPPSLEIAPSRPFCIAEPVGRFCPPLLPSCHIFLDPLLFRVEKATRFAFYSGRNKPDQQNLQMRTKMQVWRPFRWLHWIY